MTSVTVLSLFFVGFSTSSNYGFCFEYRCSRVSGNRIPMEIIKTGKKMVDYTLVM